MSAVVFSWRGAEYPLPASKVMRLGAELEEMLFTQRGNAWEMISGRIAPNINLLAMAYGLALRTAGATITDEEVREAMFFDGGDISDRLRTSLLALSAVMSPPVPLQVKQPAAADPSAGKPKAGRKSR